ncbi:hypothetical protein BD408DRAFT_467168 [Parasitella parasitica]|nr:hypothetical protein BD408DRAFT_467168 [Parasitella parasitica]
MIQIVDMEPELPNVQNRQNTQVRCAACQQLGHSRRTNRLCPLNATRQTEQSLFKIAMQTAHLPERHDLGGMSTRCPSCNALMWVYERSEGGVSTARFQLCCGSGRYVSPPLKASILRVIADLVQNNNLRSVEFKKNVRSHNNALCFTSMGDNLDSSVQNSRSGAYAFRIIHGSIYHRIGSLLPTENSSPAFA